MELRKDVEGLRGVAILLVVAAHAGVPGLAGGFVGVDVFFVLSGFLITGLLSAELAHTDRIDCKAFYARRFRRLLPALVLMLLVTGWLATQLVPIMQQSGHALSSAAAAMWLSNMHFALSGTDYFADHADLYMHTWSLGVEEQFYLIWPLLLAAAFSSGTAGQDRTRTTMLVVTMVSLILCVWLSWTSTLLAFYVMPMRAWQFALGALVYLYFVKRPAPAPEIQRPHTQLIATIGTALGLALIGTAALILDSTYRYPGLWALIPTLGTCLILASNSIAREPSIAARALTQPVMQWLGRMSYGWYLWHWPLLILGATVFDITDWATRLALVLGALAVAWVSFHLVERPIRHAKRWPFTPSKTILLSIAVMLCVAMLGVRWKESAVKETAEQLPTMTFTTPAIYKIDCDRWYSDAELTPCVFEPKAAPHRATVALLGDSIGLQWFPAFSLLAEKHGWTLVVLTKSACPMVDESFVYQRIGREYTECNQWRTSALDYMHTLAPDAVIVGSSSGYEFSDSQWRDGTRRVLQALTNAVESVGILRATPVLPFSGLTCASFRTPLRDLLLQESRCTAPAEDASRDAVAERLREAAADFPGTRLIDMNDAVCPDGICRAERDGLLMFRDHQHLNAAYVETLAGALEVQLQAAMPALFSDD